MVEISYANGIAEASSCARNSKEHLSSVPEPNHGFAPPNGIIRGWVSRTQDPPHYIWLKFQKKQRPTKISFRPYQDETNQRGLDWMPTQFQFVGTNGKCDPKSEWNILCEKRNVRRPSNLNATRECEVKAEQIGTDAYRCLGLRVLKTTHGTKAGVSRIRIWALAHN